MIVLRLLTVRVACPRQLFNLKQAQSWSLDCLVRMWAVMSRWKLLPQLHFGYHVVAGSYLRALDSLSADMSTKVAGAVLASKVATVYSRSVVGLLQLCMKGSYPTLEEDLCGSLVGLLRLPRKSSFIHAIGENMLPSLQELTEDKSRTQLLTGELQVKMIGLDL